LKLRRDLSGAELASALHRYGYEIVRQTGSHIRLTSLVKGTEHHITIPRHKRLTVGTLSAVVTDLARYLDVSRERLLEDLFGG